MCSFSSDFQLETVKVDASCFPLLGYRTFASIVLSNARGVNDRCKCVYRRISGCEEGKR